MKRALNISCCVAAILTLAACEKRRHVEEFYYPWRQLGTPTVYQYQPTDTADTLAAPYYVLLQQLKTDTATFLLRTRYSNQFYQVNLQREEMLREGALLNDLRLFTFTPEGRQQSLPAVIEHGNVFPFFVKDTAGIFLSRMYWELPDQKGHKQTLIRNRRYLHDTTFDFKGRKIPAIVMEVREVTDDDNQQGVLEIELKGTETYARGLGLVAYTLTDNNGILKQSYQLTDTLSLKTFSRMAGQ